MFDIKQFIKENLIKSVKGGYIADCTANLTAVNYMDKGYLTKEDIQEIAEAIKPIEDVVIDETINEDSKVESEVM